MNSFNFIVSSTSTCGEKSNEIFKAFLPLCTIFKFYHINVEKSYLRTSPHIFKWNIALQFQK
ncbi:hypothetical protein [Spiroplasma ixodetis]|uniref:hypothetical protein n=1 Tax=Spiroplasma ixodetis TaxID=2141 RepID=UPI0025777B3B|nr:hypothetical protein [Spiroplasma ixodetis]